MNFWKGKRVLVTGSRGFLGVHLTGALHEKAPECIAFPPRSDFDLTHELDVDRMFRVWNPDIVIHLAARCGGIGANEERPGAFIYENFVMNALMLEAARRNRVEKFVGLGSVCAYPKHTPVPFKETELWNGYPEDTNAPYGLAKRMLLAQSQAYRREYGLNAIHILPANLYGPGDNTDLQKSHVIPALVRKFKEAIVHGKKSVELWGTGTPTRDFLHVRDCVRGILLATEHYNEADPVNIGTGVETSINDLAQIVADLCGFKGNIVWDSSRPDGQPRRCLDISRARAFGFEPKVSLQEGLAELIASPVLA